MNERKTLKLETWLYISLLIFVLVAVFAKLGTSEMDFGQIYTLTGGGTPSGVRSADIKIALGKKIAVTILTLFECLFLNRRIKFLRKIASLVCFIRIFPTVIFLGLSILTLILNSDILRIIPNVFFLLLVVSGVFSFVVHIKIRKKELYLEDLLLDDIAEE